MKLMTASAIAFGLLATPAFAAGMHAGGHHDGMEVGKPGDASDVSRTVKITMSEKDDGRMLFEPASLQVKNGETIRFSIENAGELEHEFVLDTPQNIQKHKEMMAMSPDMKHQDANAIRLMDATGGEIIWTFSNTGTFEFACLIPGHYESGMKGDITVEAQ